MPQPDNFLQPELRAVPIGTLRLLLATAKAAQLPKVAYQESHQAMTYAALQQQRDHLKQIEETVSELLGLDP